MPTPVIIELAMTSLWKRTESRATSPGMDAYDFVSKSAISGTASPATDPSMADIWDEAYESIKSDDPRQMYDYEQAMSSWIIHQRNTSATWHAPLGEHHMVSDPDRRRSQLRNAVISWLADGENDDSTSNDSIKSIMKNVKRSIEPLPRDSSDAVLAWAGIGLALSVR